jgi:drug/metabolite transporter (DMT)-like permease
MNWLVIALLSPALWAAGNHIDKYLLDKQLASHGPGPLLLFSALAGCISAPLIVLSGARVFDIAPVNAMLVALNGALFVLSLLPYYQALIRDEASIVVPLFQTTAVFSYVFGAVFLGEHLDLVQTLAAFAIVAGSILLTLELNRGTLRFKRDVFLLMMLASCLNALNWLLFKVVAQDTAFWVTSFWEYVGFAVMGALLFVCVGHYRRDFLKVVRGNRPGVLGLAALNEALSLGAKTATNIASMTAPLAIVSALHGLQPLFVLVLGVLLSLRVTQYNRENISQKTLLQKGVAISLTVAGTAFLAG